MDFIYSSVISIFVISIISYVIPNGSCRDLIKWIISIIISLIMLSSIINLFNFSKPTTIENNYLNATKIMTEEIDEKVCIQYLSTQNINGAKVDAKLYTQNNNTFYKIVEIDLKKAVINSDKSHIDIMSDIEKIVKQVFGNEVKVIIYE